METKEEDEDDTIIDDHDNEDQIEEEQDREEEEILKSFDKDIEEFFEEVKKLNAEELSSSINPQTQEPNLEEFFFEDDLRNNNPIVSETQEKIADDLFETVIKKNTPKEFWTRIKFLFFDFFIIVPSFLSLG